MLAFRSLLFTTAAFLVALADGITFPLISARLEATGVSGEWIGLNATMPALGWIMGSIIVPQLQVRHGLPLKRVFQLFLAIAIAALWAMRFADTYAAMTALRLLLGGAMGVILRCIEYWITSVSDAGERGRNVAVYNVLFMIALIVGSLLQPVFGNQGWSAFGPPLMLACCGMLLLQVWNGKPNAIVEIARPPSFAIARSMPITLLAVVVYGAYECAPTTMLQIYALKNGIDGTSAAYALAAAALGNIILQYPVAALSDRVGRCLPLLLCACLAAAAAASLPFMLTSAEAFLAACTVFGGAAGSVYSLALSMVGDRFDSSRLVVANAAFGIAYAVASILGPLANGFALNHVDSHGFVICQALAFGGLAIVVGLGLKSSSSQGPP